MLQLHVDRSITSRKRPVPRLPSSGQARLAAVVVGAALTATLEVTAARSLGPGIPHPDFVLTLVAGLAIASRLDTALVAAVVGGIAVDALAFRPIGITALELVAGAGALSALISPLTGWRRAVGVVAVLPWAFAISLTSAVSAGLVASLGRLVEPLLVDAAVGTALVAAVIVAWLLFRKRGLTEVPAGT